MPRSLELKGEDLDEVVFEVPSNLSMHRTGTSRQVATATVSPGSEIDSKPKNFRRFLFRRLPQRCLIKRGRSTSNVFPRSGGGNAGGGSGGGTTPGACAPIQSLSVVPGYFKGVVGAIWTNFSLKQCNGAYYTFDIKVTNLDTGLLSYATYSYMMSGVIDYDFAPLSTNFRFDITVKDRSTGAVLDTRTAITATPGPKPPGTV